MINLSEFKEGSFNGILDVLSSPKRFEVFILEHISSQRRSKTYYKLPHQKHFSWPKRPERVSIERRLREWWSLVRELFKCNGYVQRCTPTLYKYVVVVSHLNTKLENTKAPEGFKAKGCSS